MLPSLRREVARLLDAAETTRKPFLRRSLRADALLTTDLTRCAAGDAVAAFVAKAETLGWRVELKGGLLEMDHALPVEAAIPLSAPHCETAETHALCHLLLRHPGGAATAAELRALAKAEEAGPRELERYAKERHALCAVLLREGKPLPGDLAGPLSRRLWEMEEGT